MRTTGDDDLATSQGPVDDLDGLEPRNAREGLPPTYRMRADAHYVDQLDAGRRAGVIEHVRITAINAGTSDVMDALPALVESIKHHGVLQPLIVQRQKIALRLIDGRKRLQAALTAGLRDVPCCIYDVDDGEAIALEKASNVLRAHNGPVAPEESSLTRVLDPLLEGVTSMQLCLQLLAPAKGNLAHVVALDLLGAEMWRASYLARAGRLLEGGEFSGQRRCSARAAVATVVEHTAAEQRFRRYQRRVDNSIPEGTFIASDEVSFTTALSGLLFAMSAIIEGTADASLTIAASLAASSQVVVSISAVGTRAPGSWESRAFDPTWHDRPGGVPAMIFMTAARAVATSSGGRVTVSSTPSGATATMVMPAAYSSPRP